MTAGPEMGRLTAEVTDGDHIQGADGAPVTVVEYGDYQCPYCGKAQSIVKDVQGRVGDGMRYVFRHFPLTNAHAHAKQAAQAAEAAALQEAFWTMHDHLFEHQRELHDSHLMTYADELDLDVGKLRNDMESDAVQTRIQQDFYGGVRSGVNGTPTFFINDARHDDSWDADTLVAAIDKAAAR